MGTISLPVRMAGAITAEEKTIIMTKAQSETEPASRTGTPLEGTLVNAKAHCTGELETPKAEPAGWACVYVGHEVLEEAEVTGVVNVEGSAGLSTRGGMIEFLAHTTPNIGLRGTWAVAAAE
jgi:hypothetical protein